jgi:hypothetical protein
MLPSGPYTACTIDVILLNPTAVTRRLLACTSSTSQQGRGGYGVTLLSNTVIPGDKIQFATVQPLQKNARCVQQIWLFKNGHYSKPPPRPTLYKTWLITYGQKSTTAPLRPNQ